METLGQYLRQQRLAQHIPLETVVSHTRIQKRFLSAIEEDQLNCIPHTVSAKGFIRSYAQFLQLDPLDVMQRFSLVEPHQVEKILDQDAEFLQDRVKIQHDTRISPLPFLKTSLKVSFVLALLLFFLFWLSPKNRVLSPLSTFSLLDSQEASRRKSSSFPKTDEVPRTAMNAQIALGENRSNAPSVMTAAITSPERMSLPRLSPTLSFSVKSSRSKEIEKRPDPSSPAMVLNTPSPLKTSLEAPVKTEGIVLLLQADAVTWVKLWIDQKTPTEALLQPGDKVSWKAADKILMTLGNAGGVHAFVNGKNLGILGQTQEVLRDYLLTASRVATGKDLDQEKPLRQEKESLLEKKREDPPPKVEPL